MYPREIVAGTPRIYGQLVKTLAPYTRVITDEASALDGAGADDEGESDAEDDALIASLQEVEDAAQAAKLAAANGEDKPKRTRITAAAKAAEDRGDKDAAPF